MLSHPIHDGQFGPLGPIGPGGPRPAPAGGQKTDASFEAILKKEVEKDAPLRLSAHAQARLAGQGIELDSNDLARLAGAVDQAAARGSKDSLLVYRNVGLVVNVPNRTVLTAIDQARMTSGVVTGIDSTVFVQTESTQEST